MKLAEVRVVEAARGEGRRVNRGRRPPSTLRAHSRAVPRLECTALGAGKVGWERTPPRRLCGLRWLPRQTVLRAQRQNEFEEPVGMDSRVPPLGTAASGGTWPWSGRGGEVHPKRKDPTPLREPIAVPDATAEARFLLSDLCVLVHARRRRMRNECRISLDALNFLIVFPVAFQSSHLGFVGEISVTWRPGLGHLGPASFWGWEKVHLGQRVATLRRAGVESPSGLISQVSFHVIGGENGEVQTVAGICQSVQQLPLQITQCPHPEI